MRVEEGPTLDPWMEGARPTLTPTRVLPSLLTRTPLLSHTRAYSAELDPANSKDYDAYVAHWRAHFQQPELDDFELERGLNHIFAQDWCPSVELVHDAILACRRLNTFATAVRVLEAVEHKTNKKEQYQAYLAHLKPTLDDLGVVDKHAFGEMKPVRQKIWWADA
ncbi:Cytochrome c oxidase subunit 5A [Irineochytrium annulatum]|nr:Cytochrome c oxidase subunit 5A [Irineochytrium annulatum]